MNIKQSIIAITLVGACLSSTAFAQKTYTQGTAVYGIKTGLGELDGKVIFNKDSSLVSMQQGPALIKLLANNKNTFFAVLVDVPLASIKKAAVATPDELEQAEAEAPKFTFTQTNETKQINGFDCKKVIAKESKTGKSVDIWVTPSVTASENSLSKYFSAASGFPVQFETVYMGQPVNVTLKSIVDEKPAAGTFTIPSGFDRVSMSDLNKLGGR